MSTYWPRLAAVGATAVISGFTSVTDSGSVPPSLSAPAAKTLRTATVPENEPGWMPAIAGTNGKATRVRSHGASGQRMRGDLDAADDDAGLALVAAEEEAVARERRRDR